MTREPLWQRLRIILANWFWRMSPTFRGKGRIWSLIVPSEGWFPTRFGIRLHLASSDYTSRRLILGESGNEVPVEFARSALVGGCFLDIGSNRGPYASLAGSVIGPKGTVIAVEPNSKLWQSLLKNLEANVTGRCLLLPVGILDRAGWMRFEVDSSTHSGGGHLAEGVGDFVQADLVAIQTANVMIEPFVPEDASEIRVKIDVEGAELHVLQGIESLLRRSNCGSVLVELSSDHLARFACTESQVYELMADCGFSPRYSRKQCEEVRGRDGYYDQWFEKPTPR